MRIWPRCAARTNQCASQGEMAFTLVSLKKRRAPGINHPLPRWKHNFAAAAKLCFQSQCM